jgi:glucan phosphoethanolaminetransferase (alkaline phosphatase superfamily)
MFILMLVELFCFLVASFFGILGEILYGLLDLFTPTKGKMKLFNSFQIVGVYAAAPFGIGWLAQNPTAFPQATAAFWAALALYVLATFCLTFSVYDTMRKDGPWDF